MSAARPALRFTTKSTACSTDGAIRLEPDLRQFRSFHRQSDFPSSSQTHTRYNLLILRRHNAAGFSSAGPDPAWPKAKEAAGDYSGAKADLKIYQQFRLSESEVRTVQDKLYALEAKAGAAARKQTKEQEVSAEEKSAKEFKASQENFSPFILRLEGSVFVGNDIPYEIYFLKHPMHNRGETPYEPPVPYVFCQRSVLEGGERIYNFAIPVIPTSNTEFDGGVGGYYGKFTLSSDGRTLTELFRDMGESNTTVRVYRKKE